MENADGTANGAGDHIGNFFLCMPVRPGIRCSLCDIMMEHSQHFFKQIIAMRRAQKTGQKRILHGVPALSQKIGTADIPVIFWLEIFHHGKNIMNSFILNCRDQ